MRVLFFAQLKDVTGCDSVELAAVAAERANSFGRILLKKFPELAAHRANVRLAAQLGICRRRTRSLQTPMKSP